MGMDKIMRHAVVILSHGEIGHLLRLIKFFDDDFRIYVHVDRHYPLTPEESAEILSAHHFIKLFSRYKVFWGGRSVLEAELFLLR